jgi:deoxyribonuclease-4
MATHMRVRAILDSLTKEERATLKKLIPKEAHKAPADLEASTKYPSIFISVLPDGEGYSLLGHIAEHMLRVPHSAINLDTLIFVTREYYPELSDSDVSRITKSKTVEPFLENLKSTRKQLKGLLGKDSVFEPEIQTGSVQGHPDILSGNSVFEIKLAGQPAKDWLSYVFQVFAYGAILDYATTLHLVFPLHKHVWTIDISKWTSRAKYLEVLQTVSTRMLTVYGPAKIRETEMCCKYCIGSHVEKRGSITTSLAELDPTRPWQIFLSNPTSTKISVKEDDLELTAKWIESNKARVFIHAPYLINLSSTEEYNITCLRDCLEVGVSAGFKGVVVHVGKYVKLDEAEAIENMRKTLHAVLEYASPSCPILLETPAGQGTETLLTYKDFMSFVQSFNDERLRICIDVCHIFSCGWDPYAYISNCLKEYPDLLHLVHFNDSLTECGSKLDRHAPIGTGHIGFDIMTKIADLLSVHSIPALTE